MKNDKDIKPGIYCKQGPRPYMEDTYYFDADFESGFLGGVYDGHSGDQAAVYLEENLHDILKRFLDNGFSIEESFHKAYLKASEDLSDQKSGACALNFLIRDGVVHLANVGDCHLLIIKKENVLRLTEDHRLDNPKERERIEGAGAKIRYPYFVKGNRGRMPTRGIGDEYFKSVGLTPEPYTDNYELSSDDLFLVAGTDGLFDFIDNKEIAELIRGVEGGDKVAERLGEDVLGNRRGNDNITILTFNLRHLD